MCKCYIKERIFCIKKDMGGNLEKYRGHLKASYIVWRFDELVCKITVMPGNWPLHVEVDSLLGRIMSEENILRMSGFLLYISMIRF